MTTMIETGRVAPPQGTVAEQSLPLTFFDMIWIPFHPMPQLLFYDLPISKPHFLEIIVPKLKQSLSLTLKHLFPLSGNVVYPLLSEEMPVYQYRLGDSVPFTISESSDDFDDLVGNHAQSADKFYGLIPQLSPIVEESDHKLFQVLAVQVTLFAGRGISVGITTHHCVSDASSIQGFLTNWASINKNNGNDEEFLIKNGDSLPILDRSLVNYPLKLDSFFWKDIKKRPLQLGHPTLPTNRIRSTYSFTQSDIKRLKNLIQEKVPSLVHLSSFVAITAYVWTTMAKSLLSETDVEAENDDGTFATIPMDLRSRLDPPVPESYFGNCISFAFPSVGRRELAGDEGLFLAAEAITAEIKNCKSDKNILENMEKWWVEIEEPKKKSFFSVSGSTRLDLYGLDFGWGRAKKQEILATDGDKYSMSLCKSRDFVGGLEICMSLPKEKMDAFDAYFSKGMKGGD